MGYVFFVFSFFLSLRVERTCSQISFYSSLSFFFPHFFSLLTNYRHIRLFSFSLSFSLFLTHTLSLQTSSSNLPSAYMFFLLLYFFLSSMCLSLCVCVCISVYACTFYTVLFRRYLEYCIVYRLATRYNYTIYLIFLYIQKNLLIVPTC